jgi:hypothetical protein
MKGESLYKIATVMGNSAEICRRHYAVILSEAIIDSVKFLTIPLLSPNTPPSNLRTLAR